MFLLKKWIRFLRVPKAHTYVNFDMMPSGRKSGKDRRRAFTYSVSVYEENLLLAIDESQFWNAGMSFFFALSQKASYLGGVALVYWILSSEYIAFLREYILSAIQIKDVTLEQKHGTKNTLLLLSVPFIFVLLGLIITFLEKVYDYTIFNEGRVGFLFCLINMVIVLGQGLFYCKKTFAQNDFRKKWFQRRKTKFFLHDH